MTRAADGGVDTKGTATPRSGSLPHRGTRRRTGRFERGSSANRLALLEGGDRAVEGGGNVADEEVVAGGRQVVADGRHLLVGDVGAALTSAIGALDGA